MTETTPETNIDLMKFFGPEKMKEFEEERKAFAALTPEEQEARREQARLEGERYDKRQEELETLPTGEWTDVELDEGLVGGVESLMDMRSTWRQDRPFVLEEAWRLGEIANEINYRDFMKAHGEGKPEWNQPV
jgi:hypothetical protein